MLCLQQIDGITYNPSLQPEKILLKPTITRFGRSGQHSDVVVDSSISPLMISRVHAEIHFENGKYRIDCKGLNGLLVNKTKRSSAVLCDGDEIIFGGAGVKAKEGETSPAHDSELVYVFKEVCQNNSEEAGSLGEGTSDGRVRRRSKRKQPVSTSEELSGPPEKKNKSDVTSKKDTEDHDKKVETPSQEKEGSKQEERTKKCLADLNEELLCCICRELMVLAHTLPCSHTFCFGCIRDWLAHSSDCPNCRAKAQLKSAVPVKVLDNTINKVAEEVLSPEELEERQQKFQEMQEEAKKKTPKVIAVSSTSSDSSDSELDESTDSELTSDEEFPEGDNYRFGVEHARSGRATCRTCSTLISMGALRWMVHFQTRWERYEQTHYHHLECFLPPAYVTFDELSVARDISRAEERIIKARLRAR